MGLLQEIWMPRFAESLRRRFGMRGTLRLQVPGDVQPVIIIEGDNVEHFYTRGERRWGSYVNLAAGGVGTRSETWLEVAAGNMLIIDTILVLTGDLEVRIIGDARPAGFAASSLQQPLDSRLTRQQTGTPWPNSSVAIFTQTANPATVQTIGGRSARITAGYNALGVVLEPGGVTPRKLLLRPSTDNAASEFVIIARERETHQTEL